MLETIDRTTIQSGKIALTKTAPADNGSLTKTLVLVRKWLMNNLPESCTGFTHTVLAIAASNPFRGCAA